MPEQTRPENDKTMPNRAANMEKAEGDRDASAPAEDAGGITNRPLSREDSEQCQVPPRGASKEGENESKDAKKPFVTAADPADEDHGSRA